ncbi:MAG: glycosyltransferase family 39 protein [Candidatus Gastranaerophilales bacterium]|nr:glycosyltransferase family 39 protein [Candidatus Gastranaerophilales bacterium]
MKNITLVIILLLAGILRINHNTFVSGYNYDELAVISSAAGKFPFEILKTCALNDYHAPLYQLIIHFFTGFNNEWVLIRLFGGFLSILNVYIFYKIGTLLKNKKTGYITALILAVNYLTISTASFVKFYVLVFLLTSINIYYFIKILKYNTSHKKFAFCNTVLILSSTYAFIFVLIEYIFLFIKKGQKEIYKSFFVSSTGFILYLPILILQIKLNNSCIFSTQYENMKFNLTVFLNTLNDFFTPLLNYCNNLETQSAYGLWLDFLNYGNIRSIIELALFSLIPIAIALYFTIKSILNNKISKKLSTIAGVFFIIFILFTKLGITGFVPIYLYPCIIISLIVFASGINEKNISKYLFGAYILLNLAIIGIYNTHENSFDQAKIFNNEIPYFNNANKYTLVATTGARFMEKYYDFNVISFDSEEMAGTYKSDVLKKIYDKNINKKNAKDIILKTVKNNYKNPDFEAYFKEKLYNKIKNKENIVFCFEANENSPFIADFGSQNITYKTENYSYEYLIELLEKYFKRVKFEQYSQTKNNIWEKIYEDNTNKYSTLYLAKNASRSWIFVHYQKQ